MRLGISELARMGPRFANWGPACRVLVDNISEWFALFFLLYRRALIFESTALLLRLLRSILRSAEAASSASRCSTWQLRCKPAAVPQPSRPPQQPGAAPETNSAAFGLCDTEVNSVFVQHLGRLSARLLPGFRMYHADDAEWVC